MTALTTPTTALGYFYFWTGMTCTVTNNMQFTALTGGISGIAFTQYFTHVAFLGSSATQDFFFIMLLASPYTIAEYPFSTAAAVGPCVSNSMFAWG